MRRHTPSSELTGTLPVDDFETQASEKNGAGDGAELANANERLVDASANAASADVAGGGAPTQGERAYVRAIARQAARAYFEEETGKQSFGK